MMTWKVHEGRYDAATNLAIDDLMLDKASETGDSYLRVYDFEEPAVILARNEHFDDIKDVRDSHEITRRETGGSVIYCNDNAIFYSVSIPIEEDEFPENLHREYFGPRIAETINDLGVTESKLGIGEHFSVRIDGGTVSGNSQRKKRDAVLYHGVLALEPWDAEELDQLIELRNREDQTEREFIESLPGVMEHTEHPERKVKDTAQELLIENFTSGEYEGYKLSSEEWDIVETLAEEKYSDEEWIKNARNQSPLDQNQGFCFVDWTDEWNETVERYGFY